MHPLILSTSLREGDSVIGWFEPDEALRIAELDHTIEPGFVYVTFTDHRIARLGIYETVAVSDLAELS